MAEVHAEVTVNDEGWAVTWNADTNTPLYMQSQLAFEARRAAERATCSTG